MKKELLILLFISFLFASCYNSSRTYYLKDADNKNTDSIDVKAYEKKYPEADGVFLEYEKNIQHSGSVNWTFQNWEYDFSERSKILVLNPKNEKFSAFKMLNENENILDKLYIKTISPEGDVKIYNKKDLMQQKNSSGRIDYSFVYTDIRKGTIIEEAFEKVYHLPFIGYIPLQHELTLQLPFPCEKLSFNYAFPKWFDLSIKKTAPNEKVNYKLTSQDDVNTKILSYSDFSVPEYVPEPFSPYYKEIGKYMEFKVNNISMGNVKYSSLKDWKEFAQKFEDFAIDKDGHIYSRVTPITANIVSTCKTDLEKLDKIVTYVQEDIEVDNNKTDYSFGQVLSERKGDIFTITGMTLAMLKKAGLNCDYLLIHSAEEGSFDENYISYDQFNFPAVRVLIDNVTYIVFPYTKKMPVDVIPDFTIEETAMVIYGGGKYEFVKLTAPSVSKSSINENYDISISEDGKLTANETKIVTGISAYMLRKELNEMKEDNKDEFIKSLLAYSGSEIKIDNFEIINREEYKKPLEIKFKYSIDNLVSITPEDIIFQTSGLLSPASLRKHKFNIEKRKNPVKIYSEENNSKNISISFPKNWKVMSELKDMKIENSFGMLSSHMETGEGLIKITQQNNLKKTLQPKEKIGELADLIGSNSKIAVPTIIFQRKN